MPRNEQAPTQFRGWLRQDSPTKPVDNRQLGKLMRAENRRLTARLIRPLSFDSVVKKIANRNNVSPLAVQYNHYIRRNDEKPNRRESSAQTPERIEYVGCVHGGDEQLSQKLNKMAGDPPAHLILTGDVLGTSDLAQLQKLFYNYLNNHSKNELHLDKPNTLTDDEVLSFKGSKPPEEDFTLKKGFLKLRRYERELEGKTAPEIDIELGELSDREIASAIRRYALFSHYGHYASSLPPETRTALADKVEDNARSMRNLLVDIQASGTRVHIIEGNWDARIPIDFEGEDINIAPEEPTKPVALPRENRLFKAREFFEEAGINFYTETAVIETATSLQVLIPFDSLTHFAELYPVESEQRKILEKQVGNARAKGLSIVIATHGEPNWQIHNMTVEGAEPKGEHKMVIDGFGEALRATHPDEVVYPHLHDLMRDTDGTVMPANTKYYLTFNKEGEVELVNDAKGLNPMDDIIATFIPLRHKATYKATQTFPPDRQPIAVEDRERSLPSRREFLGLRWVLSEWKNSQK